MKPEAQRIAIAEACGWKSVQRCFGDESQWWGIPPAGVPVNINNVADLPDYLSDLNAMHEAEVGLSKHDRLGFRIQLFEIVMNRLKLDAGEAIHATAAQRAEAFLRTLNLWK